MTEFHLSLPNVLTCYSPNIYEYLVKAARWTHGPQLVNIKPVNNCKLAVGVLGPSPAKGSSAAIGTISLVLRRRVRHGLKKVHIQHLPQTSFVTFTIVRI